MSMRRMLPCHREHRPTIAFEKGKIIAKTRRIIGRRRRQNQLSALFSVLGSPLSLFFVIAFYWSLAALAHDWKRWLLRTSKRPRIQLRSSASIRKYWWRASYCGDVIARKYFRIIWTQSDDSCAACCHQRMDGIPDEANERYWILRISTLLRCGMCDAAQTEKSGWELGGGRETRDKREIYCKFLCAQIFRSDLFLRYLAAHSLSILISESSSSLSLCLQWTHAMCVSVVCLCVRKINSHFAFLLRLLFSLRHIPFVHIGFHRNIAPRSTKISYLYFFFGLGRCLRSFFSISIVGPLCCLWREWTRLRWRV